MSCSTGKIGYTDESYAETALNYARAVAEKGRKTPVRYFLCEECGRYHLTSLTVELYNKLKEEGKI